ncbi:ABC transporter permease subunit [Amycolatopsis alkalitolerans]|uniref:ABC transporter permease subunit n=2 Tax=Amycolatopsis alkalitolerans TaxID=2547244 RepID=A0A5C4M3P0_9PSEU|nr:ABC transporter permease subunit [Amycolatopsis alkalitolerans]
MLGKLRAQELSKHVGTSLILGGTDIVGALQQQKLLTPLLPEHQDLLPEHDPAYGVSSHLLTTFEIGLSVIAISNAAGVPAAYVLARRSFPGKSLIMVLLALPILLPPLTYATQLSSLIYTIGLGSTLPGVILSNLVRPDVEQAARMCGANTWQLFRRIIGPLLLPGALAAGILTLVRVFGAFELTFFVSGPRSESLIVAVFGAAPNPAGSTPPLVAAMAVCYMAASLVVFAVALSFVNPTQIVSRERKS